GDHANFVAVLKVLADAGQVLHDRNTEPIQLVARADAGQFQELWAVECAAADDDLAGREHLAQRRAAVVARPSLSADRRVRLVLMRTFVILDADRLLAVEEDARSKRVRPDGELRREVLLCP